MAKKIDYASMYTLRKDGRYQGYWHDQAGKRHTVCDKDPEALYFKIKEKEEFDQGPVLFRDIAGSWHDAEWETIPEGTKASYAAHYNRAVDRFGSHIANQITPNDIDTHLKVLKAQGLAASTISKQRTIYRLIYYHAITHEVYGREVKSDPSQHIKIPKGLPKPEKREAPEDDIVQKIQDNAQTAYFGDFVMFLICTGLRRGEALALQIQDIDLVKDEIKVFKSVDLRSYRGMINDTKTDAGNRQPPILPPIRPFLVKRIAEGKPTDYLFHGENPSLPMANSCYQRRWNHYCREMGFVTDKPETRISKQGKVYVVHNYKNTLTAHVLRHGYATILFEAGVDELTAQKLMGHSDISITREIYTHLRNRKKMKSVDKLKELTKDGIYFDC